MTASTAGKTPAKIYNMSILHLLFGTCWATYFLSYMGRLNYAASMVEIGADMGYTTSMLGLVATIMFISYGVGQLIGGILGDYLPPKVMALCGTVVSAACNLIVAFSGNFTLLAVAWGVNGLAQSLIWSPILRLFSMYMPDGVLYKSLVNIQSSCALGTCVTYLLAAGLVAISGWRTMFFVSGGLLAAVSVWWFVAIGKVERFSASLPAPVSATAAAPAAAQADGPAPKGSLWQILWSSGVILTLIPMAAMGILRDGVMTWVPEYAVGSFGASPAFSIFLTAFLPLLNLSGVYAITPLRKKMSNEQHIAALMFGIAGAAVAGLVLFGGKNLILTILLFAIITSAMTGCNTAIISLMPAAFTKWGRTSASGGILNAFCYVGSAVSGYGIGLLAEKAGWGAAQVFWLASCGLGLLICLFVAPWWKRFKEK